MEKQALMPWSAQRSSGRAMKKEIYGWAVFRPQDRKSHLTAGGIYQRRRQALALLLVLAMLATYMPAGHAEAAGGISTKKYTISKKAGTYSGSVTVNVRAKKGYKVYYSTGSQNLTVKKVIKSGKKKSLTFTKTTKLKIYAVKKAKTLSNKRLRSNAVKKKTATYIYKITGAGASPSPSASVRPSSAVVSYFPASGQAVASAVPGSSDSRPASSVPGTSGPDVTAPSVPGGSEADPGTSKAPGGSGSSDSAASTTPDSADRIRITAHPDASGASDTTVSPTPGQTVSAQPSQLPAPGKTSASPSAGASEAPSASAGAGSSPSAPAGEGEAPSASAGAGSSPSAPAGASPSASAGTTPSASAGTSTSASPGMSGTSPSPSAAASPSMEITPIPEMTEVPKPTKETDVQSVTVTLGNTVTTDDEDSVTVTEASDSAPARITITQAGYYEFSGDASKTEIAVSDDVTDSVWITLDAVTIDNSALTSDNPVISLGSRVSSAVLELKGDNTITGPSDFSGEAASALVYCGNKSAAVTLTAEDGASLTIEDGMDESKEYGQNAEGEDIAPSDGISAKGTLNIESGTYDITVNGDCLKGTGSSGAGGVTVSGGNITLRSEQGNGIKSKNGTINIISGTVNTAYTASDAIHAKKYSVNIQGGTVQIDNCYGDGIQGEEVNISGGTINIKTYYEYAGKNFYDKSLDVFNTLVKSNGTGGMPGSGETKTETVNIDTGSHKGIKAGTKAKTYSYEAVAEGSDYVAGQSYTQDASGGLTITGGTITINTTKTGIKYNGSQNGSGAACEDQYIIGAPEDGIHSNNTCVIAGGNITILAADDGIASADTLSITGTAVVDIQTAYEGIEAGTITIGTEGSETGPAVCVYTNDDGINAAKKTDVTYVYADENEETYTKKTTAGSGNTLTIYSGYVNVMIADDTSHTVSLPVSGGADQEYTFNADGDGLDCNGSLNIQGGTVIVFGASSNGNSSIDVDDGFTLGEGATLFQAGGLFQGGGGSNESIPTSVGQAYVSYSNIIAAGTDIALKSGDDMLIAVKLPKQVSFMMYSSPDLASGSSYSLYQGGTGSGSVLDGVEHDCRYETYTGGTLLTTLTGTISASSGGNSGGPGSGSDGPGSGSDGPGGNSGGPGGH